MKPISVTETSSSAVRRSLWQRGISAIGNCFAKVAPESWHRCKRVRDAARRLDGVALVDFPKENRLCPATGIDLKAIWSDPEIEKDWKRDSALLDQFVLPDGTGGVSPGDRRAIYYLVRFFDPSRILEIGTHIGASTVHLAAAALHGQSTYLKSVDLSDVNDPEIEPWRKAGATRSPRKMVEEIGAGEKVEFKVGSSLEYLAGQETSYDFIFLDGDHSAETVYREIPLAMARIRQGGVILLHDYFPRHRPFHRRCHVSPGPCLAVDRLIAEGADIEVIPLGSLPWGNSKFSDQTSLALLLGKTSPTVG